MRIFLFFASGIVAAISAGIAAAECTLLDRDMFQRKLDARYSCVTAEQLRAFREPPLASHGVDTPIHTYRFIWLPAFARPLSLRLEVAADGSGVVTVKSTDELRLRVRERTVFLSRQDVDAFVRSLEAAQYWDLPAGGVPIGARDGANWILEAQRGAKYHVVLRWSPEDGPFRDSALLLVRLSGEKMDAN